MTTTPRVGAAAEEARSLGLVLTARCENHLHGVDDLDDTIARLCAYRDAGAEVVYNAEEVFKRADVVCQVNMLGPAQLDLIKKIGIENYIAAQL